MVKKSKGSRRGTRSKLRGPRKFTVNDYFRTFSLGEKVAVVPNSSSHSVPFRRFHGITGEIIGRRGAAYFVKIKDGSKEKQVITKSEHLKSLKV